MSSYQIELPEEPPKKKARLFAETRRTYDASDVTMRINGKEFVAREVNLAKFKVDFADIAAAQAEPPKFIPLDFADFTAQLDFAAIEQRIYAAAGVPAESLGMPGNYAHAVTLHMSLDDAETLLRLLGLTRGMESYMQSMATRLSAQLNRQV